MVFVIRFAGQKLKTIMDKNKIHYNTMYVICVYCVIEKKIIMVMKIIKTLTLHNARALLDCRRREHRPPVKNYGIPFAVHVHAIANGGFHRGDSAATRSDRQFSGPGRRRGITV